MRRVAPILLLVLLTVALGADAAPQRFPRPEFDSGYVLPETSAPEPHHKYRELFDITVLVVALGLAARWSVGRRSRRNLALLALFSVGWFGFVRGGCLCPVGSLHTVTSSLAGANSVLSGSAVAFFILPLATALFAGRAFCAGVCPLGALQEVVLLRPIRIPAGLDQMLGLGRHLVLGATVLFAATGALFLVCRYDPFVTVFRLSGTFGMVLYSAFGLVLATFVARPFCRWLCPYGVVLGWLARLSDRRVVPCSESCADCRLCAEACPVNAIRLPEQASLPEDPSLGRRRLAGLLALAPVVVLAFAWIGSELDGVLARTHPTVRLAAQLVDENHVTSGLPSLEVRAFRSSGAELAALFEDAEKVQGWYVLGGGLLGAYLGLVVMVRLLGAARWRRATCAEPDPSLCVSCGRCFADCPQVEPRASSVHKLEVGTG